MPSIPPGFVSWLGAEFPDLDVERVEKYWDSHHPILISAEEFSHELSIPIEDSTQILDFLASAGYLVEEKRKGCPICADHIPPNEISEDVCPGCGAPVKLAEFSEEVAFRRDGHRTRDFRWMVTIHGMNTRGAWQEDFSFQVSRV